MLLQLLLLLLAELQLLLLAELLLLLLAELLLLLLAELLASARAATAACLDAGAAVADAGTAVGTAAVVAAFLFATQAPSCVFAFVGVGANCRARRTGVGEPDGLISATHFKNQLSQASVEMYAPGGARPRGSRAKGRKRQESCTRIAYCIYCISVESSDIRRPSHTAAQHCLFAVCSAPLSQHN
jgi:hypothetical protein